jgi:pimeloyl-ACP methyl ester carboxylesterase
MMCDERLFAPQIEAFGRERPVVVARIEKDDTVEGMAGAVLRQAPERFALAGLSLGGIVAMAVMALSPERVERIALLDTNPLPERPEVAASREPQIEAVRHGGLAHVMSLQMIPHYFAPGHVDASVAATCLAMALALGPEVFIRQSRALQHRPDRSETLARVNAPTLILSGSHDTLCPLDRHELMARLIPNSKLVIIDKCGHLPTLQNPDDTIRRLREWLWS